VTFRVGIVAGEASGDTLGAELISSFEALSPGVQFFGIAGPKMRAAGCEVWENASALSVIGLFEVIPHLRRLLRLRRSTELRLLAARPDVFVGVDAKEFNLSLSKRLRTRGLLTVQYVSPQVWAWRQKRVLNIHRAVDLVLCLLPFEKRFYDASGVKAAFVGHPLADAIPLEVDRAAARRKLGLDLDAIVIALLPGSRNSEVEFLGADFAAAASCLQRARAGVVFIAPMANPEVSARFARALSTHAPQLAVTLLDNAAQTALIAADAALVTSGTASLEAALCKRPMVVIYRLGAMTACMIKTFKLVKSPFFAQPNLLAGRRVVGEYFQDDIDPEKIASELLAWIDDRPRRQELQSVFQQIHLELRQGASVRAAQEILALLSGRKAA
jgi:lipid-A-disaccharide synthase